MILWLPIMYVLTPDQNLNSQEDMWHYYIWPHPLFTEMPVHTDTYITIVIKSINKFLKHCILFNAYPHWLHRVGCKYVMVFHRLFTDIRHQKKQNVLRNIQHNDCSLEYDTLLFEHYLFQWPLMTFVTII